MTNKEVEAKMTNLKELKAMAEELKKEIEILENDLKAEMLAREVSELICGMFKATYKDIVSNKFDTTSFKKDNALLYNSYLKESISKRFTFS